MSDKDRIRLAEAMGYVFDNTGPGMVTAPDGNRCSQAVFNFDPFTDANDDYAVLVDYREKEKPKHSAEWCDFWLALNHGASYKIGDYAFARLDAMKFSERRALK